MKQLLSVPSLINMTSFLPTMGGHITAMLQAPSLNCNNVILLPFVWCILTQSGWDCIQTVNRKGDAVTVPYFVCAVYGHM